jgi:hypothetical protein
MIYRTMLQLDKVKWGEAVESGTNPVQVQVPSKHLGIAQRRMMSVESNLGQANRKRSNNDHCRDDET